MCAVFHSYKKKQAEKQEINLLQLAAFAGRSESMHALLPSAQPALKCRLINKQINREAQSQSQHVQVKTNKL